MEYSCKQCLHNLVSLDVTYRHAFQDVKETAYKGLVRQILEYTSPVWDPHGIVVQEELEKFQNRAARFVSGNYNIETGSVISMLEQLGWESLHMRRKGSKLILLFKGLKGRSSIPCGDLQPPNGRSRNHHPVAISQNLARLEGNSHKKIQISQNHQFQTILQQILWRNKHKSHIVVVFTSFLHETKDFRLYFGSSDFRLYFGSSEVMFKKIS